MTLGKAGGALMADVESLGRLISLALRSGIPIKEIYRQVRGISSHRVIGLGPNKILSVPDAVGIAIERWMQEKQGIQQELLPGARGRIENAPVVPQRAQAAGLGGEQMVFGGMQDTLSGACPDCGSQLEVAEGCMKCHVCGFGECGRCPRPLALLRSMAIRLRSWPGRTPLPQWRHGPFAEPVSTSR